MSDKKLKTICIISVIALIAAIAAVVILLTQNRKQEADIAAMEEMMTFEKEQLEDEYEDLAIQYDGYQANVSNDSLAQLLSQEQQRVQDLLEELRITKATDGRKIAQLKKELATVRAVMKDYVQQIDSLNRTNRQLVQENQTVRAQYQEVSAQNQTLAQEKSQLTEVVNRAAMMEVSTCTVTRLNKRDKTTKSLKKTTKLQFDFTVAKNITAKPGDKIVYMQIRRPDGEVMLKSEGNTFHFENQSIPYSLRKSFEYSGDAIALTLYWPVEEILDKGLYNADFFIDGNLCGSFPFKLD